MRPVSSFPGFRERAIIAVCIFAFCSPANRFSSARRGLSTGWRVIRQRMKLQEGGYCVASTSRDFAGVRSLRDAEQQADHQIAPEQPGELLGKFGRTAREQAGRLGLGHDFTQGGAACLASYRVERTRHFGGLDRLGDRQSEYRNDCGIAYLADKPCPERSQHLL